AGDVEHSAHGAGIAPSGGGAVVDVPVHRREVRGPAPEVAERRDPAVAETTGETEHPRTVRPDPDAAVVRRRRTALRPRDPVVRTVDLEALAILDGPDAADDADRLVERDDRLPRGAAGTAHRLDRVPEAAGAEAELDAAAAEQVEARGAAGEY